MTERPLPNYRWIKFPITCLDDRDFMQLDNGAAGIYLKLYLLAARSDSAGLLCNEQETFNLEYLAWHLRADVESLDKHIRELIAAGLMKSDQEGYWITRFMREQGPGDKVQRERWAERQRRSRARVLKTDSEASEQTEQADGKEEAEEEVDPEVE